MAEIVTVRRRNAADELDAAKEFLFSADAVTAKHEHRSSLPRLKRGKGNRASRFNPYYSLSSALLQEEPD